MLTRGKITYLKSNDLPYLAVLFACCLIAYWPISFFIFSLKNDALNYFLPVRYQVSEAISNGYWPFWSPYFNLGYPLHGDMQSGVWNPVVQIFSLFGPYTLRTLHYETLLYVFISGVGMFYLLKYFTIDKKICLLIGASYMLCGYNSDSAQFLNWIGGAALLPFVILFSLRTIHETSFKYSIFCGFFIYLFFVIAYPADFIILLYLLIIFFLWHLFQIKGYKRQSFLPFIKKLIIIAIVFILLSLPAILSYVQFLPLSERGHGASYQDAMSNPLHPILFFSYITPLAVWKAPFVAITDPLERNSYVGLIAFAFLIAGFVFFKLKSSPWLRFCKWAYIITIIFSLGEIGGIRPLAYYTLPLMDSFRHPANAKIFTIFFGCNIAAFAMQHLNFSFKKKILVPIFIIIGLLLLIFFLWSYCFGNTRLFHQSFLLNTTSLVDTLKVILDTSTFLDLLLINILIQLPFLLIIYLFLIKKVGFNFLLYAGLINSVIHSMLFMPFTVVKKDSATHIQHILDKKIIKNYNVQDLNSSIEKNSEEGYELFEEIGALNMYNKKIGRIDYRITPSNLNSQNIFWNENITLRNLFMQYPILYKADTALLIKDSAKAFSLNSKVILVKDTNALTNYPFHPSNYTAISKRFTPNNLDIVISSDGPGVYCLFQNFYPNWKLYIDGKEETILRCNISFMGFMLEKGVHTVSFRYEAIAIKIAFFISLLSFVIVLLFASNLIYSGKA